jgi:hypothetical protein
MGKVVSKGILSMMTEKRYPNNSPKKPQVNPMIIESETKTHFTSSEKPVALRIAYYPFFFIYHHVKML